MLHKAFEKRLKVLVMDSDPESRSLLRKELQAAHFDVIVAENEKECFFLTAAVQPDLIVFDLKMPWFDHFEIIQCFEKSPFTGDIPVVFLISEDEVEDAMAAFNRLTVDFVFKPYRFKELQARIRKAVMLRCEQQRWIGAALDRVTVSRF
jgi:PleD family two-component response regulator